MVFPRNHGIERAEQLLDEAARPALDAFVVLKSEKKNPRLVYDSFLKLTELLARATQEREHAGQLPRARETAFNAEMGRLRGRWGILRRWLDERLASQQEMQFSGTFANVMIGGIFRGRT